MSCPSWRLCRRWCSHDAALPVAPVTVAQDALVELARGEAGQLGLEVDGARAFLAGEVLLAERDQLARERRPRLDAGHGLHDGLDLLAKIGVRHAEDGRVRH